MYMVIVWFLVKDTISCMIYIAGLPNTIVSSIQVHHTYIYKACNTCVEHM